MNKNIFIKDMMAKGYSQDEAEEISTIFKWDEDNNFVFGSTKLSKKEMDWAKEVANRWLSEHDEWDGKHIHYCLEAGQSAQSATMACGRILSTWSGPNRRSGKRDPEDTVGYSWNTVPVECPGCLSWMESNLKRCDKGCGRLAIYKTCETCYAIDFENKR